MELKSSIFVQRLQRLAQPWLVTSLLVVGLASWIGWQLWVTSFDRPLPPSELQAHQLRVNSAQLEQLTTRLKTYQNPEPAPAVSTSIFNPATGS